MKNISLNDRRALYGYYLLYTGLSLILTFSLQFIPMPVLYGVFLYMGVSSLGGIQVCNFVAQGCVLDSVAMDSALN